MHGHHVDIFRDIISWTSSVEKNAESLFVKTIWKGRKLTWCMQVICNAGSIVQLNVSQITYVRTLQPGITFVALCHIIMGRSVIF